MRIIKVERLRFMFMLFSKMSFVYMHSFFEGCCHVFSCFFNKDKRTIHFDKEHTFQSFYSTQKCPNLPNGKMMTASQCSRCFLFVQFGFFFILFFRCHLFKLLIEQFQRTWEKKGQTKIDKVKFSSKNFQW